MVTLLGCRFGRPSRLKLVRAFKNRYGITLYNVNHYKRDLRDTDVLIRWGSINRFPLKAGAIELNSATSIELGCNKLESRAALQAAGVSVPKSYFSKGEALSSDVKYPLFGRPAYHTQGKVVEFIKNRKDLLNSVTSEYFSEFIQKDREFRVYVFGDKCIGIIEKIPENKNDITWNSHRGATFYDLNNEDYCASPIVYEAIRAAKVIGQYFSGVDVMTCNDISYVIELNSSVALSNRRRLNVFVEAFKNIIDQI